ncbi:VanZ family protein [Bacillus carboniphilus]|uniref:VanZ family protein n=1 Tax=Bacillus carboniphilus TaxID=86663 RepID=A0ABN0VU02_9BACI
MYKSRKLHIYGSWIIVVAWMVLIFNLSAQPAHQSNKLSKGVTGTVVETIHKVNPSTEITVDSLNHMVRKNAHFIVYLVLGILVVMALSVSGVLGWKTIIYGLGLCVLYAISDELHQIFVPGRGAQVKDVMIDSSGALVGIGIGMGTRSLWSSRGT